jgi:hypothetical protein
MRKNFFLMVTAFLFSAAAMAQSPKLFKYQGLARDSSGNPISNDTIALRISIHQGTPAGTVVYQETHNPITNEFGSFSINIGGGTVITGNFLTIPWVRYNFFQEVEMDVTGGTSFISMGTSQYLSVPYALATDSAKSGIAPFFVQNTSTGSDTASVAIIAIANGSAPAAFFKNNGPGESLTVSGNAEINGNVEVSGNIILNGASLKGGFSNFQVFNSSGTFTVPAGVTKVMVELWGAGGGGGGGGSSDTASTYGGNGGGGGGGGYVKDILNVSSGQSISVIVGNGGNGGPGGSGNLNYPFHYGFSGADGGNTSFDTMTAEGGDGGDGGNAGTHNGNGNGGSGGAGGNAPGIIGIAGQFGFDAKYSGFGGSSANGGFGGNPSGNKTPGGGGSGGIGQFGGVYGHAGTDGGNGRVIVWW